MKFIIRKAKTDRDLEIIFSLDLLVFGWADGAMGSIADLKGSEWWIVWDENMDPVGYCGVVIYDDFAIHKRCGVIRRARGHGLQRKMLRTRENYARKQGCVCINTYVQVQNVVSANNLIKAGYKAYNPEWRWGGDDYLYVTKKLAKD